MHRTQRMVSVIAVIAALVASDCHSTTPAPAPTPAPVPTTSDAANQQHIRDSIAAAQAAAAQRRGTSHAAQRAHDDSVARANAAAADQRTLRATLTETIHFDYDKSDLRDDAKAQLDAKARILGANTSVTIRIAGHTDERGSAEYNLALGQRRAATAKRYLAEHGVAESRIETISFGDVSNPVAWRAKTSPHIRRTAATNLRSRPVHRVC